MRRLLIRTFVTSALIAAACVAVALPLWLTGHVSRVKVRRASPDGRVEIVCRARLPESTEYELWRRRRWQPFGSYLTHSGTESMGRCRDVVWSPDGTLIVVVNEGNTLVFVEPSSGARLGVQGGFAPGDGWDYTSRRIITGLRFTASDIVEFEHCDRVLLRQPGPDGLYSRCGADVRRGRARIVRSSVGATVTNVTAL
ncbi:MAG TPA: hypothetical protein VMF13_05960 [Luteitalea sp.]|nr:hypothetical protein [Luteitalea sp.]